MSDDYDNESKFQDEDHAFKFSLVLKAIGLPFILAGKTIQWISGSKNQNDEATDMANRIRRK